MSSMSSLLDIGKKGIMAHQTAINVAGHNIANVNTEGYSRQEAALVTTSPNIMGGQFVGSGVAVETIRRSYDQFIEERLVSETSILGKADSGESALQKVELFFNDTTGLGLNNDIGNFLNAIDDLANNPDGYAERVVVKNRGEVLAGTFNAMSSNIEDVRDGLDGEINVLVGEINVITSRIAQLNDNIASLESGNHLANDLRDERNLLIKDLSEKVDISYFQADDGAITIHGKGGFLMVNGNESFDMATSSNLDGHLDVFSLSTGGTSRNVTSSIKGGRIGGLIEARDTYIPSYQAKIDQLAYSIADEVNTLHSSGFGLLDVLPHNFFSPIAAVSGAAGNIQLDADILADVNNIAASGSNDGVTGLPGDNTNALAMADLRFQLTMSGGTASFDDYYNSLVADVGVDVQRLSSQQTQQKSLVNQLEMSRESVSGVSLDEEMADLVRFQHAFEASARLINIADEMLTTILGMAGR